MLKSTTHVGSNLNLRNVNVGKSIEGHWSNVQYSKVLYYIYSELLRENIQYRTVSHDVNSELLEYIEQCIQCDNIHYYRYTSVPTP